MAAGGGVPEAKLFQDCRLDVELGKALAGLCHVRLHHTNCFDEVREKLRVAIA
jgi:hypothetical protein